MLNLSHHPILVVGDVMLDEYVLTRVDRVSPEAPIPVAREESRYSVPGGAANVAINLANLGCPVSLFGLCGRDEAGEMLAAHLEENGVTARFTCSPSRMTTRKTRYMARSQQLLRLDREDTATIGHQDAGNLLEELEQSIAGCCAVIISDYEKGMFRFREDGFCLSRAVIDMCAERGVITLVDPKGPDWRRYKGATCVKPNRTEFAQVAGEVGESADDLIKTGLKVIDAFDLKRLLITRSERGMLLLGGGEPAIHINTVASRIVDVSGAGDTVIATLSACVGAGLDWAQAADIANTAAGLVVRLPGTTPIRHRDLTAALCEALA